MGSESKYGIGTIVNHQGEHHHSEHAHIIPIYQTSTFSFPDAATGAEVFKGEREGYAYTRLGNPNSVQLANKYAYLEGLDLIRARPNEKPEEIVKGFVYSSGMAAIINAMLSIAKAGDTIISQCTLYGGTHTFLDELAPRYGISVVWVEDYDPIEWEQAFEKHPNAVLAFLETPANPTMDIVDLNAVSKIASKYGAMTMVDNTFATPYCQRPLNLGIDVVAHSTTKYLSGHGLVVGGVIVTSNMEFAHKQTGPLTKSTKILGATPSPFDNWLAMVGLKTFELRIERHCNNAQQIAEWLSEHPKVDEVYYPGLESNRGHEIAKKQMFNGFGGMVSFVLKGGLEAGIAMMDNLKLITLAVSLGNVDTLIQHPASMTHAGVPPEERERAGLSDGLVRLSVGIENVEDLISDLDQSLAKA